VKGAGAHRSGLPGDVCVGWGWGGERGGEGGQLTLGTIPTKGTAQPQAGDLGRQRDKADEGATGRGAASLPTYVTPVAAPALLPLPLLHNSPPSLLCLPVPHPHPGPSHRPPPLTSPPFRAWT
jgi:hypothetical protein